MVLGFDRRRPWCLDADVSDPFLVFQALNAQNSHRVYHRRCGLTSLPDCMRSDACLAEAKRSISSIKEPTDERRAIPERGH